MEKKIFGTILTILGISGLIYAAVTIMSTHSASGSIKAIAVYGVLGLIFFFAGIGLIRSTKDSAA